MNIKCLGTGSSGNCYALNSNDGKILLLDCGISIKDIKIGIDFRISDLAGCLTTHVHTDHSKSVNDLRRMGIPVITPYENNVKDTNLGGFFVKFFKLDDNQGHFVHSNGDGSECPIFGYLVQHDKEPIKLIYVTDCQFVKWRFKDINNLVIGIDYEDSLVDESNRAKNLHIYSGHLSLSTACDFIRTLDEKHTLENVIVGHMSDTASDRGLYREKIEKATYSRVYFAEKGKVIEL